jgi:hypothetical protein
MTLKTFSAIAVVTVAFGSPAFAQDSVATGPAHHKSSYTRHLRSAYNQAPVTDPGFFAAPRASNAPENEFDRSRVGDLDPDFNPSGN